MAQHDDPIVLVGAGIGGLVTALSLHGEGHAVEVFESVTEVRALGVGINLLPHAVRELDALGLLGQIERASVQPATLAYFTKRGEAIWDEPRGVAAGYRWPQVSIHRGELQRILLEAFLERVGSAHLHTGHHLVDHDADDDQVVAHFAARRDGPSNAACVAASSLLPMASIRRLARSSTPAKARRGGTVRCCGAASQGCSRCSTVER